MIMVKNLNHSSIESPSNVNEFKSLLSRKNQTNSFLGYQKIVKKRRYYSTKTKYVPWNKDAHTGLWLEEDKMTDLTIKSREEFYICFKGSGNFKFYQTRPVKISFLDSLGNNQVYKPLALLTYRDDSGFPLKSPPLLIDIWSKEDINRHKSFLHLAFRAANRFALSRKLQFKVFHDNFFLSDFFFNLSFIYPYLHQLPEEENLIKIKTIIKKNEKIKLSDLTKLYVTDSEKEFNKLIFDTWLMIALKIIKVDWNKRFHKDTLMWI